jgi:epoxide hydrolase-like protein
VQLAATRALARCWQGGYGWRRPGARRNALPQSVTETGGPGIYFIHGRPGHDGALPPIVTHGRPGSVIEQLKIIDPLADPAAPGAGAAGAFHLVIPSLPGCGSSGKPATAGWGPGRTARARAELMRRLGCARYAAQGGDRGAMAADVTGTQAPPGRLGIHLTWPFTVPPDIGQAVQAGRALPPGPARRRTARASSRPSSTPASSTATPRA